MPRTFKISQRAIIRPLQQKESLWYGKTKISKSLVKFRFSHLTIQSVKRVEFIGQEKVEVEGKGHWRFGNCAHWFERDDDWWIQLKTKGARYAEEESWRVVSVEQWLSELAVMGRIRSLEIEEIIGR
jgi:hypothetical protein